MKILIAYDGSECADVALRDLRRAGLPTEAEALIVAVAEAWAPATKVEGEIESELAQAEPANDEEAGEADESAQLQEARYLAQRACERVREDFPHWETRSVVMAGKPAGEVVRAAADWQPDLIVVGSHGHTALGRFMLGSVSQSVVTEAHCSVRVARGHVKEDDSPVRLLIGTDGSPAAQLAISAVAARSWPPGSEARVLAVNEPMKPTLFGRLIPPVAKWVEESNEADIAWSQEMVEAVAEELRATGLAVTPDVLEGDPKKVLVAEAESWEADAIFVGSTGITNRLERLFLGSVSTAVVNRAPCSVEVSRQAYFAPH